MEVATLSEQEMGETEGAFVPAWAVTTAAWTAGGGAFGAVRYAWQTPQSSWTSQGFGQSIGAGATAGFYASPFTRTVFGTQNAARFVVGGFGVGSWYR